jgi:hypothetical protein
VASLVHLVFYIVVTFLTSIQNIPTSSVNTITGTGSLSPLLGVKIVHFVDRSDLFKISQLVYDGREIVYRDRQLMAGVVR